ncbi:putative UDP-glucoronosyl and UDP-glucosyl transferase [Trypanosoma grayi]|uniref:putative UDP-glucoronosyl and UDP-glucosyl transferase n=1 Tax=Trypanosoma grayi TaxID=71804 RepID=UPI0004F4BC78|nr:putative UDP-glucoronosyl and UDP-glucosyl transferase [Trypanosoma grayi]KEG10914.1 putative UDP-glucoronosyl and UDP-glucosyl transferase [Trypanosoma grayi]
MRRSCVMAVIATMIMLFLVAGANGLRIAVTPFPERGRFRLMSAITEVLHSRGHEVTIFVPESFMAFCRSELGDVCRSVGVYRGIYTNEDDSLRPPSIIKQFELLISIERASVAFNSFLVAALNGTLNQDPIIPDVVLADIGTWGVDTVANGFHIPTVFLWSITEWPAQMNPSFPACGSGVGASMNGIERTKNYVSQRLNYWVARFRNARMDDSFEPFESFLYRRHIIAPFVFGFDVVQPFCPNVHPVGFLFPQNVTRGVMDAKWMLWMNGCSKGVIYINMGPNSLLHNELREILGDFLRIVGERSEMCVLWERQVEEYLLSMTTSKTERLKVVQFLPFPTRLVLNHNNTRVFMTHCGHSSLYESIESRTPIVGIDLLAGDSDRCARVQDAGVGIVFDKYALNASQLFEIISEVSKKQYIHEKLLGLKRMGYVMGGPQRAADVVELTASIGRNNEDFFCRWMQLPYIERHDLDVVFILSGVIAAAIVVVVKMVPCGRHTKNVRLKQD